MVQSKSCVRLSLFFFGLAVLLAIPLFVLYAFYGGLVTGEDFSPDDFTRRKFSYNIIPIINYPLLGIEYVDSTPALEQILIDDGLITPPLKGAKKWHLIRDSKTPDDLSDDFQAAILCQYLDLVTESGDNVWIAWNSNRPKMAALFWPVIARLARNNVYWAIPPIMRRALNSKASDDTDFESFLFDSSSLALFQEAIACQDQGNHVRAVELFTHSIELQPTANAYRGRSKSHYSLGNDQERKMDLTLAKDLE